MITPGLYLGPVMHCRLRPKRHRFSYRTLWVALDIERPEGPNRLFSVNRFNLFSFHERDHADGGPGLLDPKIRRLLADAGHGAHGRIVLLTSPRVLGYVFNPLSVYFCHDKAGALKAIVWEVSNTFGERHSYVLPVEAGGGAIRQSCRKRLHVSPFLGMDMAYRFRVSFTQGAIAIGIVDEDADGALMTAAMTLRHAPMNDRALLAAFARMPFSTLKTVAAIHWQALRLFAHGVKAIEHPPGPRQTIGAHAASGGMPPGDGAPDRQSRGALENRNATKADSAIAE